ncbi:invasion associated locus B family protein [Sabulicella rubraurantiaca]|uniref:invasion associated locus B family protein n=1 Tax=Sabulicella rubraurantiaca TaxID=2811429 RepID=UPI001A979069|nr:invasion associated locus B family protein [Sabulicella rubraurantiaca]
MRFLLAALLIAAGPALAQNRPAALGEFQSWTAATHQEGGQKVCYAFARARSAEGAGNREARNVMLIVTHRANGRDQVAARVGYSYARGAEPKLSIGSGEFPFYTSGDNAFARDGRAVVTALRGGRDAQLRGPGPNGRGTATDTFPLSGFSAAYEAISRECPAGRR